MHDAWLDPVSVWPAAQGQATSPAALVPAGQTPVVAVDTADAEERVVGRERESASDEV